MTWIVSASGTSSTLTSSTENTLASDTTNATYVFVISSSNVGTTSSNGDILEARFYTGINSTTTVQAWKGTWKGAQINNAKISPPIASDQAVSVSVTLKSSAGIVVPWKLLRM